MQRKKELNDSEIRKLYLDRKKSAYYIANFMDCSETLIRNHLEGMGIPRRNVSEARIGIKCKPYSSEKRKERRERVKQDYINHPELREKRSRQFKKNWKRFKESGQEKIIREKGKITRKSRMESGEIQIWNKNKSHLNDSRILHGDKIHTFNNWSSNKPYDKKFVNAFKKSIKDRDGCCMICNICFEDLKLLKRQVHIHQ